MPKAAEVSFDPVRPGHVPYDSVTTWIGGGEPVAPATVRGDAAFRIRDDDCAGRRGPRRCRIRLAFNPRRSGTYAASLAVGDAVVRLTGAAYAVGPQLVATPGGRSSVRVSNRGDAAIVVARVGIAGRGATALALVADGCSGRRLAPSDACRITVRQVVPVPATLPARVELRTALPEPPFVLPVRNGPIAGPFARPRYNTGAAGSPGQPAWSFGVVRSRFERGAVAELYTSLAAQVSVAVFRGGRRFGSRTRRVIGQ